MKSKMPSKGKAKTSSADALVKSGRKGHFELDEKELERVTGGKAPKTNDKFNTRDLFIQDRT